MMKFWGSLRKLGLLVVVPTSNWLCSAAFTNTFDYATSGSDINLTWDAVEPHYYPLHITAQLIDKDEDGAKATGYKTNITVSATGNAFTWAGIPYPLRWIPSGLYQVELRTATWNNDEPGDVVLAKSPFFRILETPVEGDSPPTPSQPPTLVDYQETKNEPGVNKPLAIGLGVSFGIPALVTLAVVGWCFRRRHQKAMIAKRRLMRSEFIID